MNDRVATCWPASFFVKCLLKPGAVLVAGAGAWRDTEAGECTLNGSHGVKPIQAPSDRYLQYVFDLRKSAETCWSYALNTTNLWASLEARETQFWPLVRDNGEPIVA